MEAKKEKIVIGSLISIALLLWFINQYLVNQLYSQTDQYVNNQELSKYYEQSNNQLSLRLLHLESYHVIKNEAIREGFTSNPAIIYIEK